MMSFQPHHVVPKTSQLNWGLCIPSKCTHKEVENVLSEKLKNFFNESGIKMRVQVRENMCQVEENTEKISFGTKAAM